MFSNLIFRNSRRSRKENGLFFGSMVISIMAFYLILSLSSQDVMSFLKKMESDGVNRLMTLIPIFYAMTLVILFFLIFFACKYQFERRRHEFGVYLMHGMRRSKLFGMLLTEDLISSGLALLIGLPSAVVMAEIISLITAKSVGMGIVDHQFSLSGSAIIWTLVGFLGIKLLALLILSGRISRQEIGTLLAQPVNHPKKQLPKAVYAIVAMIGLLMLGMAYYMGNKVGGAWATPAKMALALGLGLIGTLFLFFGMRAFIALLVKANKGNKKLHVYTFRQIQENVIYKSSSMAISSLLILAALCCFGAGLSISITNKMYSDHVMDYTFSRFADDHYDVEITDDSTKLLTLVESKLQENGLADQFSDIFEIRLGNVRTTEDFENAYDMSAFTDAIASTGTKTSEDILNNLRYQGFPTLISLSSYNHLLEMAGETPITLQRDEAAIYIDPSFTTADEAELMNEILLTRPKTTLAGETLYLTSEVQTQKLCTDRIVTYSFALIVPDEVFLYQTQGDYFTYVNAVLSDEAKDGNSLMSVFTQVNEQLNATGLQYESYLQNMGRNLFFKVASSYITIYLAIVFLVVANTIMGVQFLMSQQKTGRRCQTLIRLGATYETLCQSAGKQIRWFMGLPVVVAAASSMFGIRALLIGLDASSGMSSNNLLLLVAALMMVLLCIVEFVYIIVVKRASDKYLLKLMDIKREE